MSAGRNVSTRTNLRPPLILGALASFIAVVAIALLFDWNGTPPNGQTPIEHPDHIDEDQTTPGRAEDALTLPPRLGDILQLITDGRLDLARIRLQPILSRTPEEGRAHFLFGLTFHREMRYAQAREHFERAIELAPYYAHTYHFYGYCLYNLGELSAARRAFESHLAHVPDEGDSHFGLGLIHLAENRLDQAAERFRRAIELETQINRLKGVAKARARLGETYDRMGRHEQARDELELATQLNPDLYEAWFMLYRVLIRLGEEEAADRALAEHEAAKQRMRPEQSAEPPGT